jgi:hypothetical protein
MRTLTKAAVLAVALAVPMAAFASQDAKKPAAPAKKTAAVASHNTAGTVKTVSDTSLVITKGSGKNAKDETFTVNASTKKDGDIATGAHVTVMYTVEGKDMVATSIKAAPAKAPAKKPAPKK